ncbi:WhiB family transcriptional regulator [Pseudonocardia sp. C8]|uniref:WhiB family transcriptional regulator n=1 Tax=Pseudonocardia sp. C8 TaxID=2762759 RepID=UPI0016428A04|nr:WhiB family transcriptional regulator [Pseudonocardia sp. C8]
MHSLGRRPETGRDRDWRSRAACAGTNPETFFPTAPSGAALARVEAAAKRVCAGCPVQAECRVWALEALPFGVAGGLSESERAALRRRATRSGRRVPRSRSGSGRGGWANASPFRSAGYAALAAGRDRARIARECGVSRRTVERWAADLAATGAATAGGGG